MQEEERLSLREAADALGVSEVTARRWVKAGKLKAYQPGRKYLVPRGAIDELLESESGKVRAPSSQEKLFNNGGLEEERRARYQLSWRDYITLKANQIASQADDKGYAPEWMSEIAVLPRDITRVLFDTGVLGNRQTYPTDAEWRQSWEIFDALTELNQAVERAWRAQIRESEQMERQREAAAELDSIWQRAKEASKSSKEELEAIREERSQSA